MSLLPVDDEIRQQCRLWDYYYKYFPGAQVAKARHSYQNNLKHMGTEGMKWSYEKSIGDGNQIMRHLMDGMEAYDRGDLDDAQYHFTALAWRGDELLERLIYRMPPFDRPKVDCEDLEDPKDVFDRSLEEARKKQQEDRQARVERLEESLRRADKTQREDEGISFVSSGA